MTTKLPKIVVITPVKNEAWILDRFLSVTSQFADHIIIADQNSTDGSQAICKKYPKVILIENKSQQFNEAERQLLLIQTARDLVQEHKIILALDADEILAANATKTASWQKMLQAEPGTILFFEKPDLFDNTYKCIRSGILTPLGYVDDGAEHQPRKIHSVRVPMPEYGTRLHIHDIKILHYAFVRLDAHASKIRMYSVIENILEDTNAISRRFRHPYKLNYLSIGKLEACPHEWFDSWEDLGIDMHTITKQQYYSYDFEVLHYFHKYGCKRFWMEDIWKYDWESCRQYAKSQNIANIPDYKIPKNSKLLDLLISIITNLYGNIGQSLKHLIFDQ
ncbi:glycosyltransferase family 2 protein [Cuspidothrix issatschenkoi]|jgi:glycosyltransferase involved in cell wall biosynthesis|uniref:Glycosyltransferase family 2 protein n=1 Tax=Cuspidothrix issatschenkoi CHARLIE-1 TaxID=2052836 RepID=A0A2S6CTY4_9CYAN|nr:glycosyltransferase family 2 protein [Cuspidothrix issatschenkoi]PPJ63162.1 glycosyltransferase family 2 protein [Cuspidothrix issatschenkoi CHARLIE-1]